MCFGRCYQQNSALIRVYCYFPSLLVLFFVGCSTKRACQIPQDIISQVQEQRGLHFKEPVPCHVATEREISDYLKRALYRQNPPERLFYEGISWKLLGLLPPDFDYVEQILRLYTRRIEAYYDPEEKHFVILQGATARRKRAIMVHELTHALQDQHYGLTLLTRGDYSNDELLARLAFIEGDAQRITYRSAGRLVCELGQSEVSDEQFLKLLEKHESKGADYYQAPALEQLMSFPYTLGLRFSCQMKRQLSADQYEQIFSNPPQTTRQILHPQYDDRPDTINEDHRGQAPIGHSKLFSDVLGEYVTSLLLREFLSATATKQAIAGFVSDRFELFREDNSYRLTWETNWKTFADAEHFAAGLREVLKLNHQRMMQKGSGTPFANFNYTIKQLTGQFRNEIVELTILAQPLPPPLIRQ